MTEPLSSLGNDDARFPATRLSLLQRAQAGAPAERAQALNELARAYWPPLYCFLRRSGQGRESAKDLTQGFFVWLLERETLRAFDPKRGKFRTFLLACLKGYWGDERDRQAAGKRGGDRVLLSLDAGEEARLEEWISGRGLTPEEAFETAWAHAVLERAVGRVRRELEGAGAAAALVVLEGYLASENPQRPGREELARRAGLSETAVRHHLEGLRRRLREALLQEVRQETGLVEDAEAEAELAWILRHGEAGGEGGTKRRVGPSGT